MKPPSQCTIDIVDGTVVVAGELDVESSTAMADAVVQVVGPRMPRILLDLSEVTFIDSAGLHALLRLRSTRAVEVISVSPRVERILEITGTRLLVLGPTPEHTN